MATRETSPFTIDSWEQQPVDAGAPAFSRATVRKTYTGFVAGTAVAEVLVCGEIAYSAMERFTGSIGGRTGTVVLVHGATRGTGPADHTTGMVVPGTGTGELEGLTGAVEIRHDADGTRLTIEY